MLFKIAPLPQINAWNGVAILKDLKQTLYQTLEQVLS